MLKLHPEILRPPQRRLWDQSQRDPAAIRAQGFLLAGGTALALQIGHRESHDFDFFSRTPNTKEHEMNSYADSWIHVQMLAITHRAMTHFTDLDGEMPVTLDSAMASGWQDVLRKAVRHVA